MKQIKAPISYIATDLPQQDLEKTSFRHFKVADAISEIIQKLDLSPGKEIAIITLDGSSQNREWIYKKILCKYSTQVYIITKEDCQRAKEFKSKYGKILVGLEKLKKNFATRPVEEILFGNQAKGISPLHPSVFEYLPFRKVWNWIQEKFAFSLQNTNLWWKKNAN